MTLENSHDYSIIKCFFILDVIKEKKSNLVVKLNYINYVRVYYIINPGV